MYLKINNLLAYGQKRIAELVFGLKCRGAKLTGTRDTLIILLVLHTLFTKWLHVWGFIIMETSKTMFFGLFTFITFLIKTCYPCFYIWDLHLIFWSQIIIERRFTMCIYREGFYENGGSLTAVLRKCRHQNHLGCHGCLLPCHQEIGWEFLGDGFSSKKDQKLNEL